MSTIRVLEDFQIWQKSRILVKLIFDITSEDVFNSRLKLKSQIESAVISVSANLAEGFGRKGNKEFLQFQSVSMASLTEVKSHIYNFNDLQLITDKKQEAVFEIISEIERMIHSLMRFLKKSPLKGSKYK